MTVKSYYGLLLGLILVLCVLLAGCSSQSSTTTTAKITTQPQPKYTAGDVVGMTATSTSGVWLIISYDPTSDQYTRATIYQNSDGTWGHLLDSTTLQMPRVDMEKVYPVLISHVTVSSVPVVTPTVPTVATTTLSGPGPLVSTVSPTTGGIGTSVSVTITGSNFQNGASVSLVSAGVQPVAATSVSVSSTQITCTFNLNGLNAGPANIQVTNPDERSGSASFTLGLASPTISSISPTSGTPGNSYTLTLNGQTFSTVQLVNLVSSDGLTQIPCSNPSVAATTISCTLALPSSANPGVYGVEAISTNGMTGSLNSSFTINNATST